MTTGPERRRLGAVPRRALLSLLVAGVLALAVTFIAGGGIDRRPPDGTRTTSDVADEVPPGAVLEGARDIESTVARQGDAVSAAVTYVVDGPVDEVLSQIEGGLGEDWVARSSSSDGVTSQTVLDGPDEAVLTVSARAVDDATGVAAVLARG